MIRSNKHHKTKSLPSIPNKNICVPIGSILAVQYFYEKLNFCDIFSKHKSKGLDLNSLVIGLLSYKLTDNFSIKEAGKWLNQKEILDVLNLESFHERVLYRTLELLGRNKKEILCDILDSLFSTYGFEETNINLDWTSIVLHGTKANLGKFGYSRDHRPDKLQITVGVSELKAVIDNKKLPKKFRVNNELIEINYSFRTKLEELSDEEVIELLKASLINGREGFFGLKSNRDLTLEDALITYRKKGFY